MGSEESGGVSPFRGEIRDGDERGKIYEDNRADEGWSHVMNSKITKLDPDSYWD